MHTAPDRAASGPRPGRGATEPAGGEGAGSGPERRRSGADVAFLAVVALATAVQLLLVDDRGGLANGDFYLRNATDYAHGSLAHSRYSPGFGLLLAPLARIAGDDFHRLTLLAELAMVPVVVAALVLLHRFLRLFVAPWTAVGLVATFALGQAGAFFLAGVEVEALVLALTTGALLALMGGRTWLSVALGAAALLVRAALAPFFGVLWLLLLVQRRGRARGPALAALAGLASAALAVVAHVASGPRIDQSYVGIGTASYGDESTGASGVLRGVLGDALERLADYLRFGIPRLVVPFRVLDLPVGPVVAAAVLGVLVAGLVVLVVRRPPEGRPPSVSVLGAATLASAGMLGALLLWPVRAGESTRLVIPLAGVLLVGMGAGVEWLLRGPARGRAARLAVAGVVGLLLVNLASTASVVRSSRSVPGDERRFHQVHEQAAEQAWAGPVISRKPAYTELVTGRPSYSFPVGGFAEGLDELAERARACAVVVDELDDGMPPPHVAWVDGHTARVIATAGATRIVALARPWCPAP